jgi:hypothetical protein
VIELVFGSVLCQLPVPGLVPLQRMGRSGGQRGADDHQAEFSRIAAVVDLTALDRVL